MDAKGYLVIVEWDGKTAPSRFYNRIREMGLKTRTEDLPDIEEKGLQPIMRRLQNDGRGGVVLQESVYLTPSLSQSRLIAIEARSMGARAVYIAPEVALSTYSPTDEDLWALGQVEKVYARRGRPPIPQDWTVLCNEQLTIFEENASAIALCPDCKAANILIQRGRPDHFVRDNLSVWDYWQYTRFYRASFMLPVDEPDGTVSDEFEVLTPTKSEPDQPEDIDLVRIMRKSPVIQSITAADSRISFEDALLFLDSIFVSRRYRAKEERERYRIGVVTHFFKMDGGAKGVSMAERPRQVDAMDATHFPPEDLALWMKTYRAELVG